MQERYFQARSGWIRRVPHGFSWGAFFFGPIWAFANRGPLLGLVWILVTLPIEAVAHLSGAHGIIGEALGLVASGALMFFSGRYGHRWLAWSLRKQGYEELATHAV
ncbi:MAG: DUF2628 domain-containing protein [Ramlibacter sp.]